MDDELHIWQASIDDARPHLDPLVAALSDDEVSRGRRLINPEHGLRFLLAHAILRDVLSRYVDKTPQEIVFNTQDHGKPYLPDNDLQFNLTHSNEKVLLAVTPVAPVGIDLEFVQKTHHFDDLVERFFSDEEQQAYQLYGSEGERRMAFYRAWTRKEAYLKATGVGLSYPLNQFAVSLAPDEMHCLLRDKNDVSVRAKWTVFSFDVDDDYLASVAIEAPIKNFQTFTWSFRPSY